MEQKISPISLLAARLRRAIEEAGEVLCRQPDTDVVHRIVPKGQRFEVITTNDFWLLEVREYADLEEVACDLAGAELLESLGVDQAASA